MSDAHIIGDSIGAALTARAIEPAGGHTDSPDKGHTHESSCLNCQTPLLGSHCHACGQAAHVHRTLGAFFHDLLHGVFHFEGKVWHTIPMLAFRPGELTRRYIDGQRARFVSPLALFLFSVFLMFAVIQQTAGEMNLGGGQEAVVNGKLVEGAEEAQEALADLKEKRAALASAGKNTTEVDEDIASAETAIALLERAQGKAKTKELPSSGFSMLDEAVENTAKNPKLALYKLQTHAYKYSWLLIPISVPFLWLLFPFSRRFPLYDHTVFVTYSITFMSLLTTLVTAASALGAPGFGILLAVAPPIHIYRQLRGAYGCSRTGALMRTVALGLFAFMALSIFIGLIAAETASG